MPRTTSARKTGKASLPKSDPKPEVKPAKPAVDAEPKDKPKHADRFGTEIQVGDVICDYSSGGDVGGVVVFLKGDALVFYDAFMVPEDGEPIGGYGTANIGDCIVLAGLCDGSVDIEGRAIRYGDIVAAPKLDDRVLGKVEFVKGELAVVGNVDGKGQCTALPAQMCRVVSR